MAIFGYARVSTLDQKLDAQNDALKKYGCDKIFVEKASGKNLERPQLTKLLEGLREKDIVVIYKLDRLGRSLKDLIEIVNLLASKNVDFISISDGIDTSTAIGKLMFHLVGAFAEFERNLISERTIAGLASARARGRIGGKPKGMSVESQKKAIRAKALYDEKQLLVEEICKVLEIKSKTTFYKYLKFETARLEELKKIT
ncbi:recombinase family protein [Flavobacterium weaverense]|uniref:DNA invertase Pin-like site-specific DNA recombinase n=1 Tax=Flavobacterium weaverense TaxID=271156 RepID=A0A3L9ZKQ7_9FLAO|nr:recombinase family protein [Flavobacterium weaverense]RMA73116.1 DNA invertase Pin-like site-specific DNA recombinase [Flavobacterium weaverense]